MRGLLLHRLVNGNTLRAWQNVAVWYHMRKFLLKDFFPVRIRSELLILLLRWGEQKDRIHARDLPENDHAILATLFASLALADDFKTSSGKEYKDATVSRVTKIRCKMLLSFAN